MRYIILLLLLPAAFWACQPEEACISAATNRLVLDFYVGTENTPVLFRSIRGVTTPAINFLEAPDTEVKRVILALDPQQDSTAFVFERSGLPNDTLVLGYQRRYRLISPDCPLEVSFSQLQVIEEASSFALVNIINAELFEPSDEMDVQIILTR